MDQYCQEQRIAAISARGVFGQPFSQGLASRVIAGGLAAVLLALLMTGPVWAQPGGRWASGRILVQARGGLPAQAMEKVVDKAGGRLTTAPSRLRSRLQRLNVRVVQVPAGTERAVAQALARNPHIKFAEVDALVPISQTIPNDTYYPNAWHLPKIQAPSAWDSALGDGVTVAILGTGVDPYHPDLADNLVAGWNVISNNSDSTDINGHGTAVAGTVAAISNNGLGVTSVAWHAKIMPIRITNSPDGWAYYSDIASGIIWAADHGAQVANVSYDASGSSTVTNAANYMKSKGGVVVVSAGNSSGDPGHGADSSIIAVSATNSSDTRPSWSSYGKYVDLSAPGVGIYATKQGGGYWVVYGTSFSSPITAGVVALIKSVNPALSPDQIAAVLMQSAQDLGTSGWDPYYGFGRVNAAAAVALAMESSAADNEVPVVAVTSPAAGSTVSGLVGVTVNATDNLGVSYVELYAANQLVGRANTAPYEFAWDSTQVSDGPATLLAYAYDEAGNRGQSVAITVTADNADADSVPPQVSISSPANGASVSGQQTLSAAATDNTQVAKVRIYLDGVLQCAGAPSVSCGWNARKASLGDHVVSAVAEDAAGNSASMAITVIVERNRWKRAHTRSRRNWRD